MRVIYDAISISPHRSIATYLHGTVMRWLPTRRAPAERWPIYSGHFISSIIRDNLPQCQYLSTHRFHLGQPFFGETTSIGPMLMRHLRGLYRPSGDT
jgi:hypothetical protein